MIQKGQQLQHPSSVLKSSNQTHQMQQGTGRGPASK